MDKKFRTKDKFNFFSDLRNNALKHWALKRHPNKGKRWIVNKYYTYYKNDRWRFFCKVKDKDGNNYQLYLTQAKETLIRRHKKIIAKANPFDPTFRDYFKQRMKERKACEYNRKAADSTGLRYIQPF